MKDAFGQLKSSGKLTLWCSNKVTAGSKRSRGNMSESENETENELETNSKCKKQSRSEEMEARCNELVQELHSKHENAYSMVQYQLWAEMIIAKTHESIDEAPNVPMFGGKRPRGRAGSTGELSEALTGMAQCICDALSPKVTSSNIGGHGAQPSPSKIVELRSKYAAVV